MNKQLQTELPSLESARVRQSISPTVLAHLNHFEKVMYERNEPDLLEAGAIVLREHALKLQNAAKDLRKPRPKVNVNELAATLAAKIASKLEQDPKAVDRLLSSLEERKSRADKGFKRGDYKGGKHGKAS